eukprot:208452_1
MCGIISITYLALSYLINVFLVYSKYSNNFPLFSVLLLLVGISNDFVSSVLVASLNIFGIKIFNEIDLDIFGSGFRVISLFQTLPQLIIQIVYSQSLISTTTNTYFALIATIVSILINFCICLMASMDGDHVELLYLIISAYLCMFPVSIFYIYICVTVFYPVLGGMLLSAITFVIIMFIMSLAAWLYGNCIHYGHVSLRVYALEVFNFIVGVNLVLEIIHHGESDINLVMKICAILSITLPYLVNLCVAAIKIKPLIRNFSLFFILVGISNSFYPSLQVASSNIFENDIFASGLSTLELNKLNIFRTVSFIQSIPQLLIQVIYIQLVREISINTYCALIGNIIFILRNIYLIRNTYNLWTIVTITTWFLIFSISILYVYMCVTVFHSIVGAVLLAAVTFVFIMFIISLLAWLHRKTTSLSSLMEKQISWFCLNVYALDVFNFVVNINLMVEIVQHEEFDTDFIINICGIMYMVFLVLSYLINLCLAARQHSEINNFPLLLTLVGISGGFYSSLQIASSNIFGINLFDSRLTSSKLDELIRFRTGSFLQA